MSIKEVILNRDSLVKVLRDLETVIISLDRIGSAASDVPRQEYQKMVTEFLEDWDVASKLADARRVLSNPFSTEIGKDDMDELEREVCDARHWTIDKRKPS